MAEREGQQLGNYRLIRLLGRGGFADVYLGQHLYLHTKAAIKVLQSRLASSELESFLSEARTIASLRHPRIIRVLDFGVQDDTPFLVMDYAPNGTLRQRYPKGTRLPLMQILTYVKQVAEALQYAHDNKLIHRDVKPENMLLGNNQDVLLSDFGIAMVTQSSRYQRTQEVVGTAAYMAPEQLQGKPRPASDQYALGIVVYECLTGDLPFHGTFTEVASQHLFVPPPPLHQKLPTISRDVEEVMQMALAKDPQQRFMTIQAFANALEQAGFSQSDATVDSSGNLPTIVTASPNAGNIHNTPAGYSPTVLATPSSWLPQPTEAVTQAAGQFSRAGVVGAFVDNAHSPQRGISRRMVLAGLGVTGLIVGGGLISLAVSQLSHTTATTSKPTTSSTPTTTPTSSTATTPTTAPSNPTVGTTLRAYSGHADQAVTVAWLPTDGRRIASGSEDKTVQIWNALTGGLFTTYQSSKQVYALAPSPLGQYIAFGGEDAMVQVRDTNSGNTIATLNGHSAPIFGVAWSPNGAQIVTASADKTAKVWNASTGSLVSTYSKHTDKVWAVVWSPNGQYIASASWDGTVQIWNPGSGNNVLTYHDLSGGQVRGVSWSPNGQYIASGGNGMTIQVWNAGNGNLLHTYSGHSDHIEDVQWSPNGQYIASASKDKTARIWNASSGNNTYTYNLHSAQVWAVAWAPDSSRVASASADHTVRIWQAT